MELNKNFTFKWWICSVVWTFWTLLVIKGIVVSQNFTLYMHCIMLRQILNHIIRLWIIYIVGAFCFGNESKCIDNAFPHFAQFVWAIIFAIFLFIFNIHFGIVNFVLKFSKEVFRITFSVFIIIVGCVIIIAFFASFLVGGTIFSIADIRDFWTNGINFGRRFYGGVKCLKKSYISSYYFLEMRWAIELGENVENASQ